MNILYTIRTLKGYSRRIVHDYTGLSIKSIELAELRDYPAMESKTTIKLLDFYGINNQKYAENFYSAKKKIHQYIDELLK